MVENLVWSNTDSLAGEEKKVVVVSIVSIFDQSVYDPLLPTNWIDVQTSVIAERPKAWEP